MSEVSLSLSTWFWLIVPQSLIIGLSIANYFIQRKKPLQ